MLRAGQTVTTSLLPYGEWTGETHERRGASGLPLAGFQVLPPSQTPLFRSQQARPGVLPAPMMAKTARLPQATVPRPSYCSVPGPSASIVAAPSPTCQQWLPGGDAQGQPGARVHRGAVQLRGGFRGAGVDQCHGEGGRARLLGRGPGSLQVGPTLGAQVRGARSIPAL